MCSFINLQKQTTIASYKVGVMVRSLAFIDDPRLNSICIHKRLGELLHILFKKNTLWHFRLYLTYDALAMYNKQLVSFLPRRFHLLRSERHRASNSLRHRQRLGEESGGGGPRMAHTHGISLHNWSVFAANFGL